MDFNGFWASSLPCSGQEGPIIAPLQSLEVEVEVPKSDSNRRIVRGSIIHDGYKWLMLVTTYFNGDYMIMVNGLWL